MQPQETTANFARACKIEALVLRDFIEDVDCAIIALDEILRDADRTDAAIAKVVAMRIQQS